MRLQIVYGLGAAEGVRARIDEPLISSEESSCQSIFSISKEFFVNNDIDSKVEDKVRAPIIKITKVVLNKRVERKRYNFKTIQFIKSKYNSNRKNN